MAYFKVRRFRRRRSGSGGKQLHPLAIIGICAAVAVLAALLIGNLLNRWLDEETLNHLTGGTSEPPTVSEPPRRAVPVVKVYPYTLGASTSSLTSGENGPPAALSVSVNNTDGSLNYTSEVGKFQGLSLNDRVKLTDGMQKAREVVPYLSGVFYPQADAKDGEDRFYAQTVAEGALLREFARVGASEIVLAGLSFASDELAHTVSYIQTVRSMLPGVVLGVTVPLSVAQSAEGWELLPSLRECADFLLVDLREESAEGMETALLNANYYIVQYEMRLFLSEEQTEFIAAAEATVGDFQIACRNKSS